MQSDQPDFDNAGLRPGQEPLTPEEKERFLARVRGEGRTLTSEEMYAIFGPPPEPTAAAPTYDDVAEMEAAHIDGDRKVHRNFDVITSIAQAMRAALSAGDWAEAGRLLRQEWEHRRKNIPGISTDLIDRLVKVSRRAGAMAGKVCGAGGGGCVIFLVEPEAKQRVEAVIAEAGAEVLAVRVAEQGVRVRAQAG